MSELLEVYRRAGVRRLRWLAADDSRTCERCRAADRTTGPLGRRFRHVGVVEPPAHEGCRCTTVAADDGPT